MTAARPRIALFTLEALPNARAVRRLVADRKAEIAFVGLSNAERPAKGGLTGQIRRHLVHSGPGILPYLAVNFGLPDLLRPLAPLTQRLTGTTDQPESTPLSSSCRRLGIPAFTVDDVNGEAVAAAFREHAPDLILAYHFDQIFSAETLARVPLGGINLHPGLLPKHRGPVPTIYALREGDFGVTVHALVPQIDAGAILAQEAVSLPGDVTATRAARLLHDRGRTLVDGVLDAISEHGQQPEGRRIAPLPYCPFPDRAFLADLRRRGLRLTDAQDLREASIV